MKPRQWLPAPWYGETIPATVDHPSDTIRRDALGLWRVEPPDATDEERRRFSMPIVPGDFVAFCYNDDFGVIALTIEPDGSSWTSGSYPPRANCFRLVNGDDGDVFDSLAALVASWRHDGVDEPLEVEIYHWSGPVLHRFEIVDGQPRFTRCPIIHEAPAHA